MVIRELFARLGLDFDGQSFLKAEVAFAALKKLASAVVDAVEEITLGTARAAEAARVGAAATGLQASAYQELIGAASLAGVATEDASKAVVAINKHLGNAAAGSEESAKVFSSLGVRIRDASGHMRSADAVLADIADKFQALPDGPKKTAAALKLFEEQGARLVPFLSRGAAGIAALRQEARDAGLVLDDAALSAGQGFASGVRTFGATVDGLKRSIGAALLPEITKLLEGLLAWIKANRAVIRSGLIGFARGLLAVVKALAWAFGLVVRAIEWVVEWGRLAAILFGSVLVAALAATALQLKTNIGLFIATRAAAIGAAIASAAAWLAAVAPFVLLAAAIALAAILIEDLIVGAEGGESVFATWRDRWREFVDLWSATPSDNGLVAAFKRLLKWGQDFNDWMRSDSGFGAIFARTLRDMEAAIARFATYAGEKLGGIANFLGGTLGFAGLGDALRSAGGPAAAPAVRGAAGGGSTVIAPATVQVQVNAAPGQSVGEVGDAVADRIARTNQDRITRAAGALP